jgi:alkanesulfonate monooxygenase SsuD/methylene tetrahydromethanopterin reductase-like flavin-dependent oxidoreductase (luciferase family)
MHFSLFYNFDSLPGKPVAELYRDIEQQAITADRLGFDAIYLAEHHFALYGHLPDPLLYLARLSGLTRRIGLGTAIVAAPHYNPLRLAEDAALLDVLSSGRVRLGVGSGARNKPAEFEHFNIPIDEKSARTHEITAILHQAFDDGFVNYAGRYYQYNGVPIDPRPLQPARDLIWLAASDSTVELAGNLGYRLLIPRAIASERYQVLYERYQDALDSCPGFIAQLRFVFVAESERIAHAQTRQLITRYAAGVRHDDALRAIELLGSAVLPRLQTTAIVRAQVA